MHSLTMDAFILEHPISGVFGVLGLRSKFVFMMMFIGVDGLMGVLDD